MTTNISTQPAIESDFGVEPLWTVEEVANYLRLTAETVRVMARRGELPSIKVGKRVWRFKISEIKQWVNACHESTSKDETNPVLVNN